MYTELQENIIKNNLLPNLLECHLLGFNLYIWVMTVYSMVDDTNTIYIIGYIKEGGYESMLYSLLAFYCIFACGICIVGENCI